MLIEGRHTFVLIIIVGMVEGVKASSRGELIELGLKKTLYCDGAGNQ